jgi:hypothetical protein
MFDNIFFTVFFYIVLFQHLAFGLLNHLYQFLFG